MLGTNTEHFVVQNILLCLNGRKYQQEVQGLVESLKPEDWRLLQQLISVMTSSTSHMNWPPHRPTLLQSMVYQSSHKEIVEIYIGRRL